MQNTAIFIPARLGSSRLPNKPLIHINEKPMIAWVLEQAQKSNIKDIYVACCGQEVADVVEKHGGIAIMTDPNHSSGTDRIFEALEKCGKNYEIIVNVQGDLPTLDHKIINEAVDLLIASKADISTLAAKIDHKNSDEIENPNVVKPVIAFNDNGKDKKTGRALYFTRASVPYGEGDLYHHIGLYCYTYESLKKFINLPQSPLEKREKLEQLRALENNMQIAISIVDSVPLGVDTKEDLDKVIKQLN